MNINDTIKDELKPTAGSQNALLISKMKADQDYFEQVFKIALSTEYPYAWRASWCIQKMLPMYLSFLNKNVNLILKSFPHFSHHGQQGCMIKVLNNLDYNIEKSGLLIDNCIQFLKNESIPDYVKYYSMELLVNTARKMPEFKDEFCFFIEEAIPKGRTYMIKVKALKLLDELRSLQ